MTAALLIAFCLGIAGGFCPRSSFIDNAVAVHVASTLDAEPLAEVQALRLGGPSTDGGKRLVTSSLTDQIRMESGCSATATDLNGRLSQYPNTASRPLRIVKLLSTQETSTQT